MSPKGTQKKNNKKNNKKKIHLEKNDHTSFFVIDHPFPDKIFKKMKKLTYPIYRSKIKTEKEFIIIRNKNDIFIVFQFFLFFLLCPFFFFSVFLFSFFFFLFCRKKKSGVFE
jgi:hypothetical protein